MKSLCSLGHCRKRGGRLKPSAGAHSDIGHRPSNEDLVFAGEHCRLYVALDGVGGAAGGAEASRILLDQITRTVEAMCESASCQPDQDLKSAVARALSAASTEMLRLSAETPKYAQMGTVFALAYIVDDTLLYTHVGDARVYLVRRGKAQQLTTDETYVQLMVDVGVIDPADVPDHPMRNVILNAVGTQAADSIPVVHSRLLLPDDIVLLTTDGISDKLSPERLGTLLSPEKEPDSLARAVVDAAMDAGTRDNASCVVVRVERAHDHADEAGDSVRDELHSELNRLHELLGQVDSVDDDLRTEMAQLAREIEEALNHDGTPDIAHLRQQISDRALAFEVSHPHLTNSVATIAHLLSSIGI